MYILPRLRVSSIEGRFDLSQDVLNLLFIKCLKIFTLAEEKKTKNYLHMCWVLGF